MVRIVLVSVLCLGMTSAFGQQEAAGVSTTPGSSAAATTAGAPAVASAIAPAKYSGRVTQDSRWSDFVLDLSKSPGTITMYRAAYPCGHAPISVTGVKDGIVRLESREGVIRGCERVFELTVSGNELTGTMIAPDGTTFNVKATKQ